MKNINNYTYSIANYRWKADCVDGISDGIHMFLCYGFFPYRRGDFFKRSQNNHYNILKINNNFNLLTVFFLTVK